MEPLKYTLSGPQKISSFSMWPSLGFEFRDPKIRERVIYQGKNNLKAIQKKFKAIQKIASPAIYG